MINAATIQSMIDNLREGKTPLVSPEDIPCFSAAALQNNPALDAKHLDYVLQSMTDEDVPTLERALVSLKANDQAWLGFKIVTDAEAALTPVDENAPTDSKLGPSADDVSCVFFANEGKDIVCSRPWNKRDRFQMLDVTRGPSMHKDQFAGLTWASVPLFTTQRIVVYGAGDVSVFLTRYAHDCGFTSIVIDDDEGFLAPERFEFSDSVCVSPAWDDLKGAIELDTDDYCVCVSRGHEHDVESLAHCLRSDASYIGMMGNPGKNADVYERLESQGFTRNEIERVHAPIGIKIADKTPAEIAISIVAELIDVRGKARKETVARVNKELQAS